MSNNGHALSTKSSPPFTLRVMTPPPQPQDEKPVPSLFGIPLKWLSLVTLAVQNAALTIIMHTSRVSIPKDEQYSAATAVLLNEILKGSISLAVAMSRMNDTSGSTSPTRTPYAAKHPISFTTSPFASLRRVIQEVFSADCWKLSIPALLYVIQNNLQFVAASNLDAATFQVTYQMKILTTAAFSVLLLRRKLAPSKWVALLALAAGVGIVQMQQTSPSSSNAHPEMNPLLGFLAVTLACITSGLAGVYFEMVLKNSTTDLWVRNVQLSFFSLLPALAPALFTASSSSASMFAHFGGWAWATVLTQVIGGLLTALVIKYADNILKGFATSLAILLACGASLLLFDDFHVSLPFLVGSTVVLASTWLYNQPADALPVPSSIQLSSRPHSVIGSPVEASAPILGHISPQSLSRTPSATDLTSIPLGASGAGARYLDASSPPPSRPPSRLTVRGESRSVSRENSTHDLTLLSAASARG